MDRYEEIMGAICQDDADRLVLANLCSWRRGWIIFGVCLKSKCIQTTPPGKEPPRQLSNTRNCFSNIPTLPKSSPAALVAMKRTATAL